MSPRVRVNRLDEDEIFDDLPPKELISKRGRKRLLRVNAEELDPDEGTWRRRRAERRDEVW